MLVHCSLVHAMGYVYCYTKVQVRRDIGYNNNVDDCITAAGTASVVAVDIDVSKEQAACVEQYKNNQHMIYTLLELNLAIYFTVAGRFLFFVTGHRMDFGALQVNKYNFSC